MDKWKKKMQRNKNFIGSVAFFMALLALFIGVVYGVGKKTDVYAKESKDDYSTMLENLNEMERMIEESKELLISSIELSEESVTMDETLVDNTSVVTDTLIQVQMDIEENKTDILNAIEALNEDNANQLWETYVRISRDYQKISEEFDASMNSVKSAIESLSKQSNTEYEDLVDRIGTLQDHLLKGNKSLQDSIDKSTEQNKVSLNEAQNTVSGWLSKLKGEVNDRFSFLSADIQDKYETLLSELNTKYEVLTSDMVSLKNDILKKMESEHKELEEKIAQLNNSLNSTNAKYVTLEADITELKKTINTVSTQVNNIDRYYPVGSLYLSLSDTNPASLFGGTWQKVAAGQNLMGAGNSSYPLGSMGGSYTNTLSVANLPNYDLIVNDPGHAHSFSISGVAGGSQNDNIAQVGAMDITVPYAEQTVNGVSSVNGTGIQINSGGGNQAFSIVSPYLVVNVWKRIA